MDLATFTGRLDDELSTTAYADLDASVNGLQVGRDEADVQRVAVAVDAAAATIETAVDRDADVLVVHHGLSWGGIDRITGRTRDRIARLLEADVALYVSHLPLDGHQSLGNAAGVADLLGLENRAPFGDVGPEVVGQLGTVPGGTDADTVAATLDDGLDHGGEGVQVLDFGPERLERVAVVTGSGADWFDEAVEADADAFVTGEGKGKLYHQARESDLTVFLGGHYATETFGVRSLADLIAEWGLETTWIDAPTGL
ncbi:MAG: Nif3-like dinuclear metal center hexameric protein [Halanaeroarchaeum sp.]